MTPLYCKVVTDPVDKSALTVEVWHNGRHAYARVGIGPGTGPHVTTSSQALADWIDALIDAHLAFDAAQADLQPAEQQLALEGIHHGND